MVWNVCTFNKRLIIKKLKTNNMCTNNSNCNCTDNTCGCKTSTNEVSYQGPTLACVGINNCDSMSTVLQQLNSYICSDELVHTIINNISNNVSLYEQFTTIVNQTVNCETVLECYTTTTTTLHPCEQFSLNNTGETAVAIIITDCTTQLQEAIILEPGSTNICVVTDSPLTVPGTVVVTPNGPCTTSTTSTTSTSSTTTTTTTAIPCECLTFHNTDVVGHSISYKNCSGTIITEEEILANEIIQVCGSIGSASDALVTISIGANCIEGLCPTTTTTTTICNNPNVVFNGTFTRSLIGWSDSVLPDWQWSALHGGSAHYIGRDENATLYQNVLTPGTTYDISFDLWCENPTNLINVFAGTTEYTITGVNGYIHVTLILPCVGTTLFGIQGIDSLGEPFDTIYIKNVNVSVHCPQFTTTTTTTLR